VLFRSSEPATFDILDEHLSLCRDYDELSQVLYFDMKMYLEGDILVKVDRASMACSLEVRVPLLNNLMLDFAQSLPIDMKLHGLTRKFLLRKAVENRIPDDIIKRPKKGFGIPIAKWFRSELRDLLLDALSADRLRHQGLFNEQLVDQLLHEHLSGERDHRKFLWPLLVFQLWHGEYIDRSSAPAYAAQPA